MKLPIHGFVLAGGRSARMGQDKALLPFRGRPMVEIAVGTLATVCERVSIAGNRDDLEKFAPIVGEDRCNAGPIAGIEAGLPASSEDWALFMPVDLPLAPSSFLRTWAERVLCGPQIRASFLCCGAELHPSLCLLHKSCSAEVSAAIASGSRSVQSVLQALQGFWLVDAAEIAEPAGCRDWFTNVNTPLDLAHAEKLES